ncbi:MAG: hypothetical protein NVSMB1_10830 [Polyangiales bacterium]
MRFVMGSGEKTSATSPKRSLESQQGPGWYWFVVRALDGFGPKLALFDAVASTVIAILVASVWRTTSGPRGNFEEIVPMLGTGLRWSVALPVAWGALGALQNDRQAGVLHLAHRRSVSARRWILGRALGAFTLVALTVGGPMILLSLVLAGFGGGAPGVFARLSLIAPALAMGVATGCGFGLGAVVLGALVPSRLLAIAAAIALTVLGALVDLAVPGLIGAAAHQLVSPFLALEDLQAALFDAPHSARRGVAAAIAIVVVSFLGVQSATLTFEQERPRHRVGGA